MVPRSDFFCGPRVAAMPRRRLHANAAKADRFQRTGEVVVSARTAFDVTLEAAAGCPAVVVPHEAK